jgi:glutamate:GABA antiporter
VSRPVSSRPTAALPRTLGRLDIVLLNITAIVSFRWLSVAAQVGPSSLTLWVLGLVLFLLPSALAVAELNSRYPGEGGLYLWTREAFGEMHAFLVGWAYWVANLVFFPSLLIFSAGVFLYIHGGSWLGLAESSSYTVSFSLLILWLAIILNITGLGRAKWLANLGLLVACAGAIAWYRYGSATVFDRHSLLPDMRSLATLSGFATMALAYVGLELGPILGGEIRDPQRTIASAMLLSCTVIAAVYIVGTASLLVALPAGEIGLITGIPQALTGLGARIGFVHFGAAAAALLTLAQIGSLGAWIGGTARLPFLFGLDRYLPRALGAVHPRFGSPHVALLVQGLLTTIVLLAAVSGSAIHEAFLALIDMSMILTYLPLLYLFAALPVLRRRDGPRAGLIRVPGGRWGYWCVAACGIAVLLLDAGIATIPPASSTHRKLFAAKVLGGCLLLSSIGLLLYVRERRSRDRTGKGPQRG